MSKLSLVEYTDSSSDEEEGESKMTGNLITSGKKVAVVQPTLLFGHVLQNQENQTDEDTSTGNPPAPPNSPDRNVDQGNNMDQNDMEDFAHILIDLSQQGTGGNVQNSGNLSPVIEISSSPLNSPVGVEFGDGQNDECEIIDISSDSDTIPYQVHSSPVSENSPQFDLYNEFDDILSDRSVTTGKKNTIKLSLSE